MVKIAIVGIACDLPSGSYSDKNLTYEEFFDFLQDRGQAYEDIPANRLNIEAWHGSGLGQINVKRGAFLKDIDTLDNLEFGISQTDARLMAPVTRKLIETCFLALLDSGIEYRARNVGCFTSGNSFDLTSVSDPDEYTAASFAGYPSMVANRVSYHLDLLGPSLPTDTACSSTMSALHLAVQAVLNKNCESAVVGGCQLNYRFMDWIQYTQGGILSKDGKCKPFDKSADGFGRGEGCVAIVIKTLEAALRDDDHIYATILSTAVNNSGATAPAGAPVAERQRDATIEAYQRASVDPKEVDYIELHATGTAKGDPTEANWVGEHFKRDRDILVGSVKGNIGHTEIVSLLASLAKVLHIFHHQVIPPNVQFITPNPAIRWGEYRLRVPTQPLPLPTHEHRPPLISMASSGIGGANGHILLEGPPKSPSGGGSKLSVISQRPILIMAGGLSPRTALAVGEQITQALSDPSCDRASLATVLGRRSKQLTWRTFGIALSDPSPNITFPTPVLSPRIARPIVFLFSGQGPQHKDMGRELFNTFAVFRESVEHMDEVHKRLTGSSLITDYGLFTGDAKTPEPWPITLILPSITIFQLALYDLLSSLGIRPDAVIGHSAGETAVLHACGGAPKEMAVEMSIIRGQTFTSVEALGGTMAALSCDASRTEDLIRLASVEASNEVVEIACYNSPSDTAIAGHRSAIERVVETAKKYGILGRIIRTQVPIHSSMMEACRGEYLRQLEDLFQRYPGPHVPSIKTYSTFTGEQFRCAFEAEYFWQNTRGQVHFTQAMKSLSELGALTIIEISPHPVLTSYTAAMVNHPSVVLSSVRRPKVGQPSTEYLDILELCGQLTINGHNCVNFNVINSHPSLDARHTLPAYPFVKKQFALYPDTFGVARQFEARNGPLNHKYLKINKETHPTLAEHVIRGQPIMPAAGFIEMALEFGATALMNVEMRSILSLSSEKPVSVQVTLDGCHWKVISLTAPVNTKVGSHTLARTERLHADGYLSFEEPQAVETINIQTIRMKCTNEVSGERFYSHLVHAEFGVPFRRLVSLHYNPTTGEALSTIQGLDSTLSGEGNYIVHPAILDACFHSSAYPPFTGDYNPFIYYLPAGVDTVLLHRPSTCYADMPFIYAYLKVIVWNPDSISQDIVISDGFGHPLLTLKGFRISKHRLNPPVNLARAFDVVWKPVHDLSDTAEDPPFHPDSVVFTYKAGAEDKLQGRLNELDVAHVQDIWVLADHGEDGNTCLGLLRAAQREFPLWKFRHALFPSSLTLEARIRSLERLPISLSGEPELFFTESGKVLVSRLEVINRLVTFGDGKHDISSQLESHLFARVDTEVSQGPCTVFLGTCSSRSNGSVVGFTTGTLRAGDHVIMLYNVVNISTHLTPFMLDALPMIPGFLTAILALGPSAFRSLEYAKSQSILLTHADTPTGLSVAYIYSYFGIPFVNVHRNIRLSELCNLGRSRFDVVVSGYDDSNYIQAMSTLLRPGRGKTFLWNTKDLHDAILREPCTVQEALQLVVDLLGQKGHEAKLPEIPGYVSNSPTQPSTVLKSRAVYHPNRAYLIIGGIGGLGLHIAFYLYKNGARHIVLTSRSGYESINRSSNVNLRKMIAYLRTFKDLEVTFEAVDGSSEQDMKTLVQSLTYPIGACFILSAVLADAPFQNISPQSFSRSRDAKVGVLHTLMKTIDVHELDFLVAFSSVSGTIGNQGQANYAAANTALEGLIDDIPNAFSFICPGILDSSLMLGTGAEEQNRVLRSVIPWSISAEDMIVWLDDAIQLLLAGQKVSRYVPDLDWDTAEKVHGLPRLGRHLAASAEVEDSTASPSNDHHEMVRDVIRKTLKIPAVDFQDDIPLTSYGLDSLSASRISVLLRQFLVLTQIQLLADISANDIFQKMADVATEARPGTEQSSSHVTVSSSPSGSPIALLEKYFIELQADPGRALDSKANATSLEVVLITGTTGALGCNILFQLLSNPHVRRVYALNRNKAGSTLAIRQATAFSTNGFPPTLVNSPKLILLEGDLSLLYFGLDPSQFDDLFHHLTHVIHAAWKINFMAPLSDYNDLLKGMLNLLQFCISSVTSLSFISTIAVYFGAPSVDRGAEEPVSDPASVSLTGGYIQSKWIAERLVQLSCEKLGLQGNVLRLGLISGGVSGAWNTDHWLPALIQSGVYVGCLPDGDSLVSWIPLDLAASSIIRCHSQMNETVHIIHPSPTTWNAVITVVAKTMKIPLVPYDEWLARLEYLSRAESSSRGHANMAALPLLDFYREGPKHGLKCKESLGLLPTVAIGKGRYLSASSWRSVELDVELWLKYWRATGFISC